MQLTEILRRVFELMILSSHSIAFIGKGIKSEAEGRNNDQNLILDTLRPYSTSGLLCKAQTHLPSP